MEKETTKTNNGSIASTSKPTGKDEVEKEHGPKLDTKAMVGDLLYGAVKSIGGAAFKYLNKLQTQGEENIPAVGKAILMTVSEDPMRDMILIGNLTGRKVHFMLNPKLMKQPVVGPLLKTLGMFRSTISKDDTEPIEKVFEILNETKNLVAMTPEARLGKEIVVKSVAAILKFAIATQAPIIPLAIAVDHEKVLGLIPREVIRIQVGTPVEIPRKFQRDKFRDDRYKKAEEIVDLIEDLRVKPIDPKDD